MTGSENAVSRGRGTQEELERTARAFPDIDEYAVACGLFHQKGPGWPILSGPASATWASTEQCDAWMNARMTEVLRVWRAVYS